MVEDCLNFIHNSVEIVLLPFREGWPAANRNMIDTSKVSFQDYDNSSPTGAIGNGEMN